MARRTMPFSMSRKEVEALHADGTLTEAEYQTLLDRFGSVIREDRQGWVGPTRFERDVLEVEPEAKAPSLIDRVVANADAIRFNLSAPTRYDRDDVIGTERYERRDVMGEDA